MRCGGCDYQHADYPYQLEQKVAILREVLEVQGGYRHLDAAPATLTAKAHRPAYGSDGDYFSKPSVEDVVEKVVGMVRE